MSAYIVDKATIDAIVTWATDKKRNLWVKNVPGNPNIREYLYAHGIDKNLLGQALWDENVRSVNYRYTEADVPETYAFVPVSYFKARVGGRSTRKPIEKGDIAHIVSCYQYQSCEHPEWETSWAKQFTDAILINIATSLASEHAPWGIGAHQVA